MPPSFHMRHPVTCRALEERLVADNDSDVAAGMSQALVAKCCAGCRQHFFRGAAGRVLVNTSPSSSLTGIKNEWAIEARDFRSW